MAGQTATPATRETAGSVPVSAIGPGEVSYHFGPTAFVFGLRTLPP
jgi:hypothetical protein